VFGQERKNETRDFIVLLVQGVIEGHQPGQAAFKSILPEDIEWKSFSAFPPSARLAVLVGDPQGIAAFV